MSGGARLQPGVLRFLPGRPLPTVQSTRPLQLARLLAGRAPADAPRLLPALYTLCGGAHRLAATLACDAALGRRLEASDTELAALRRDTLREHLRRLWLDWPRLLLRRPPEAEALAALGASPPMSDGPAEAVAGWVQEQVLGESANRWLARWAPRDDEALRQWAAAGATLPARALQAWGEPARLLATQALPPLPSPPSPEWLAGLWQELMREPDFERAPHDAGQPCETGPWTRGPALQPPRHALDRLLSRVAETALLACASGEEPLLQAGAGSPAPGQGIGWCEMARGTLLHAVALEGPPGAERIAHYRVLAPTEWNFHPQGAAARALALLPAGDDPDARAHACALLAAAFDPCVEFEIGADAQEEAPHA